MNALRSRTPPASLILAEIDRRMIALKATYQPLKDSTNPQQIADYHEALGGYLELEAVRDMIAYRRSSLTTNPSRRPAA